MVRRRYGASIRVRTLVLRAQKLTDRLPPNPVIERTVGTRPDVTVDAHNWASEKWSFIDGYCYGRGVRGFRVLA
jgi:hypothetical protein